MSPTLSEISDPLTWSRDFLRLEKIRRPRPKRGRNGRMVADAGGEFDWYYALDDTTREYIRRDYMAPDGLGPDELATQLGTTIDDAMARWLEVVLANKGLGRYSDVDEWEAESVRCLEGSGVVDVNPIDIVGPVEIAQRLSVGTSAIRQWRRRNLLPPVLTTVSGMDLWDWQIVETWARNTGRLA
jgi:hypothetical protein